MTKLRRLLFLLLATLPLYAGISLEGFPALGGWGIFGAAALFSLAAFLFSMAITPWGDEP
jgi:hypothetical protein